MPGLFYSYIWTFVGFGFIIASISEMASMAPTSGGQYHWVSEWSSPRYQKFLSYLTGKLVFVHRVETLLTNIRFELQAGCPF